MSDILEQVEQLMSSMDGLIRFELSLSVYHPGSEIPETMLLVGEVGIGDPKRPLGRQGLLSLGCYITGRAASEQE